MKHIVNPLVLSMHVKISHLLHCNKNYHIETKLNFYFFWNWYIHLSVKHQLGRTVSFILFILNVFSVTKLPALKLCNNLAKLCMLSTMVWSKDLNMMDNSTAVSNSHPGFMELCEYVNCTWLYCHSSQTETKINYCVFKEIFRHLY